MELLICLEVSDMLELVSLLKFFFKTAGRTHEGALLAVQLWTVSSCVAWCLRKYADFRMFIL